MVSRMQLGLGSIQFGARAGPGGKLPFGMLLGQGWGRLSAVQMLCSLLRAAGCEG